MDNGDEWKWIKFCTALMMGAGLAVALVIVGAILL